MLLSYRAWQDQFDADPNILGRTVRANRDATTIVGVMPEGFDFPAQTDAWLPLRLDPLATARGDGRTISAVGRPKSGVSPDQIRAEMTAIASRLAVEYPQTNDGVSVVVRSLVESLVIGPRVVAMLFTMLAAVFGVLLIACANVSNLILGRTLSRSKEIAICTALGSTRAQTVTRPDG